MSKVALIQLPYDSGHFEARMGRGPRALLEGGLADALRKAGHAVEIASVRLPEGFHAEGRALVELQRGAVAQVREALQRDARPLLLSGNCGTAALTALAALGTTTTGVIWFDAHGDFNTPETSGSGFLDGMCLAIATGQCWLKLAQRLESFAPIPMEHVVQIGVRDLDAEEARQLERSGITRIASRELARLPEAVQQLSARVAQVYVHLDADVLDTSEGRANSYASTGGLRADELYAAIKLIGATTRIAAASIASYDPEADCDGRIGGVLREAAVLLLHNQT